MKHRLPTMLIAALVSIIGAFSHAETGRAQTMADYSSAPPFAVESAVPPNVLLVLDNSGSMNSMAYSQAFDPATTYFGLFDPLECYDYGSNKFIPDPAANPAAPETCDTAPYLWSGNLLNYGTMRRVDVVKWVMMGGTCSVGGRDAQGGCRQLIAQTEFDSGACCRDQTQSVARSELSGMMPQTLLPALGGTLRFHLMGSNSSLKGSFCLDDDGTRPSGSDCGGDGDGYNETGWRIRVDHFENSTGVMQEVGDKARFGLMEFRGNGDGGKVLSDVGTNLQDMLTGIEATTPSTWTPLAESLYEASRYFAQVPPAYTNSNYSYNVTNRDPFYFTAPQWASTGQFVPCCRSFVILFTDGEPTKDKNIPATLQDYADGVHGTHCTGAGCVGHRTDYASDGSHYLDDVAYWAHTTDLRQATIPVIAEAGKTLPGVQSLTVYTFFAFGSGSELLKMAAKTGGFEDKNSNNQPDLVEEWDRVDNLTGALGPDGSPDTYFESEDAFQLRAKLLATITSILQRSFSGSSVSVLASSATGEGALYQSYFYPVTFEGLRDVTWTGYTQGLFVDSFGNLREDTNGDATLVYEDDLILQSRFDSTSNQVLVDRFLDADGNGLADSATPVTTVGLKDIRSIWEAGRRLAETSPAARNLMTWVDFDQDKLVDLGESLAFTTANAGILAPYLQAGAAPYTAGNIIDFVRGAQVAGLRDRQLTVGGTLQVWKLGDAIHGQPLVVGAPAQRYDLLYGDTSYATFFNQYRHRRQVAYLGANDGMLHAFNAGHYHRGDDPNTAQVEHGWFTRTPTDNSGGPLLGEELFGFIPQELLPHLRWLTQPDYTHVYYVDLTPKVTDARIFTPDADHPNGWGTILMGGFRLGGSCGSCTSGTGAPPMTVTGDFNYDGDLADANDTRTFYSAYFVLDITNPESADYPRLLWSFSSADLGLTTTVPAMLRVSPAGSGSTDNADAGWYMIVGSGPTGYDGSIGQSANLYAIDLASGPGANNGLVTTLPAEALSAFIGDPIPIDKDFDYRVDVAYAGSVIHDGSLPWRGKLYRLTMNTCTTAPCTPMGWGIPFSATARQPTEVLDTFPASGSLELGPIATRPAIALDAGNHLWVFAGTGRNFSSTDKTNTDPQYFVGLKDTVLNGGCTESTRTGCHVDDLVDVSGAKVCLLGVGDCGTTTNQVTGVSGATDMPSLVALVASKEGWFTTLPNAGERVLSRPLVFGGLVFFPTFAPSGDVCTSSGESRLYALHYLTGGPNATPVIGTTGSGGNTYVDRSMNLGQGMATGAVIHVGHDSTYGKAGIFIQNSQGQVLHNEVTTSGAITSRMLSWYTASS